MRSKIAVLVQPRKFEIEYVDVNNGPDEVLLKIEACGLCNWELNHWKGLLDTCPMNLGHEISATVIQVGENVKGFEVGDFVTGMIDPGFTEYVAAKTKGLFKVNKNVNKYYALSEPLKCIVTVLRAAVPEAGDVGIIVGCGPMGLWCIQGLSGHLLSSLIAIDISDEKLELAKKFGATHLINSKKENVEERLLEITKGRKGDFLIEATGIPSVLNSVFPYLKDTGLGRLVICSSYESVTENIDFRQAARRGIDIKFALPRHSIDGYDDWRRSVELINNGTFTMEGLISHIFTLDDIQKAFETLENKPSNYIKGIVVPQIIKHWRILA